MDTALNAGVIIDEAVILLVLHKAVDGKHWKLYRGGIWYPYFAVGAHRCHLRALYFVSTQSTQHAIENGFSHTDASEVKAFLVKYPYKHKGKVHWLCQQHWVSMTPSYFTDDTNYWRVRHY